MKKKFINKAVFLDRDGVINYDFGYVYKIKDFKFKKNVFKAVKFLNKKNYLVIVITNQSGIGRGYYKQKDLIILHNWMKKKFRQKGAYINDIYYSPYYEFSKNEYSYKEKMRRKPNKGMIIEAKNKWLINIKNSFMVGDRTVDKKLAFNAKLKFIKVNPNSDLFKVITKNIKR